MSETAHSHAVPLRVYILVFGALMILTGATVGAAYIDLGALNVLVALTIAVCKGTLVVLFFMHVYYSDKLVKVVAAAGFLWMIIFLVLTLADFLTREWIASPQGW